METTKKVKTVDNAVKKAKKEVREAEEATYDAQVKVVEAATVLKGAKKKNLTDVARDLEKANYLVAESCESTEEAELKLKNMRKIK